MTTTVDVGVDLGTTVTKAVALDGAGRVVARASLPTAVGAAAPGVVRARPRGCRRRPSTGCSPTSCAAAGDVQVRSVGFCSIAETGALVEADGHAVTRLLAWHDPRGGRQAAALEPSLAAELPSRTGLSVSSVASLFKLLWWRDEAGLDLQRPAVARAARAGLRRPGRRALRGALDAGPHRVVGHPRRGAVRGGARGARHRRGPRAAPGRRRRRAGTGPRRPPRRARPRRRAHGGRARPPRRGGGSRRRWCRQPVRLDGDGGGTRRGSVRPAVTARGGRTGRPRPVGLPARRRLDHLPARGAAHRAGARSHPRHPGRHDDRAAGGVRRGDAGGHRAGRRHRRGARHG